MSRGAEVVLWGGLVRVVLDEDLRNRGFCELWVGGVDELQTAVEPWPRLRLRVRLRP